ncbi:DegT/DnrJ/EryC1/StrS family aminotransferase [Methanomicrobium mobile]|uniref:DegT/DnrJ/EryC1/StrS family aminotransferase n=1 Tax=Methanomicrobium mobile TaxID=2205 RepID=UPI0005B2CD2E|nr:DegT/DnrJ/EryC1/StrS family aminotransferase [Methanomicrobium mobile]
MIPIAKPYASEEEATHVREVILSGMMAAGDIVHEFEQKFVDFCGAKYGVATTNGTSALHAAVLASGISKGDEVIVPAFTFYASASCVSMCGATPVFADILPDTYNLDPKSVENKITDKTKAIIGVHLFGQCCNVTELSRIAKNNDITFIEDAAQAHGAEWKGVRSGCLGDMATFSFYPTKNMTTGEGGMIVTNDYSKSELARVICNHGQTEKYRHTMLGYNYRMTNINAAIGLEQLKRIEKFTEMRIRNAKILSETIQTKGITVPFVSPKAKHVYHQYVIRVEDDFPMTRDELMSYLASKGIGSAVHYPIPLHKQPYFAENNANTQLPVSEDCAKRVLSIPVHPAVTEDECLYIADTLNSI